MKRGQIALFVIIAILIVVAVGFLVYTQREAIGFKQGINAEIRPINSFIEDCIKSTGEDALIFVGKQGGYFDLPKNLIDSYAYYFYDNKSYLPSKEIIENQISLYMNEMLPFCTKNFVDFKDFQIEADPEAVNTKTTILKDKITFDVSWLVSIKKLESTYTLNQFSADVKSRMNAVYSVIQNMTEEQLKDPSSICISCLTELAIENDFYINMEDYGNDTTVFTITDNKILINDQNYNFVFANRY